MVRRRWKAQGGSAREGQALPPRCISGPVPGTSSRLGHKRDPQLPAVAFTERTFVKRVSFNFACKKIILHIFCTSLTVPIEPGPCGFAEGRGHDFLRPQPHPRGEGGIGKRQRQPGNREPGGRAGGCPAASPRGPAHARLQGPQSPAFQPSGGQSPAWRGVALSVRQEGSASSGQNQVVLSFCWAVLLFCGLTFFLTACCSFHSFGFSSLLNFVFPGGGEEESVYKVL